jgi:hypothetical protein
MKSIIIAYSLHHLKPNKDPKSYNKNYQNTILRMQISKEYQDLQGCIYVLLRPDTLRTCK